LLNEHAANVMSTCSI